MEIKGQDIIFLFGAGASADAGIPISNAMVTKVDDLVINNAEWRPYKDLYHYLKSSIYYSDGILGKFNEAFNIERLLIVISEIEKRESNLMYPFIGTWNIRLLDLAGNNFENLKKFHKLIRKQLNEWVGLRSYENANYYQAFSSLSTEIGQLIKVFTLNYDLCFETVVGKDKTIELGFTKGNNKNEWHYSNFEQEEGKSYDLYKLHGSIDWYIENNKLYKSEKPESNPELIFGIQHKMTSVDPYFYYSSILRTACFSDAKLIVIIGYSYADEYVNVILSQALNARSGLRLLNVSPSRDEDEKVKVNIVQTLNLDNPEQVLILNSSAKDFMTNEMNKEFLAQHIGEPDDVPFA